MTAQIIRQRPREGEHDSYAGTLYVNLTIGLDDSDEPATDTHQLARLLLQCAPERLTFSEYGPRGEDPS